ncbi:TNF receptor-associated factor 6-like [Montipora foliosa]|uniref:TNF receptor-associated factor 6-like n=1 Tax=Montipora foliosa TaxID=591990 RepID=UPI0035F1F2A2
MDSRAQLIPLNGEQNVLGGYDFEFRDEPSSGHWCPICLFVMRNSVQTTCGHRFCKECLLRTFRESNARICPKDRIPLPQEGGFFADVAWDRDVLCLHVKCKRNERGCDWTAQLRHYQEHVKECLYEDVACAKCNEHVQRGLLRDHETSECRNRIVQCEHCEEEFEFWHKEVHDGEKCTRFPVECPQQCKQREIPREELESHIRDDCLMTVVACPYNDAGCNFSDKRINLEAHMKGSNEDHLRKTWNEAKKELNKLKDTVKEIQAQAQAQAEKDQKEKRCLEILLQRSNDKIRELNEEIRVLKAQTLSLGQAVFRTRLEEMKSIDTRLIDLEQIQRCGGIPVDIASKVSDS